MIDIDDLPENVCKKILASEHIFSSSLHGIIFAHALGRPATLVSPKNESLLKYQDYYASVDLGFPLPLREFDGRDMSGLKLSPEDINYRNEDFDLPNVEMLAKQGVIA